MVARRGLLGGAATAAALLLSGCGLGKGSLEKALNRAAEDVDGVTSAGLEVGFEAEFRRYVRGSVETSAASSEEALEVYGAVMAAIVAAAYEHSGREEQRDRQAGEITLLDASGAEYDMWDLRPELEAERGRLDGVLLSDFEG
ncbi:hypothetical protein NLU66_15170 [Brachybacterium sp. NBEC-018]|uniref:hypothetical protein n=1 Tax=Brachybacterium sp. NBEC-018 TaxID=2996004 RepID=UPI002174D268|nr:hypothetical protein [Brachybacterium sp. NBEC-018]UVY83541.1 hypothetical protein NLU66_15170 [Brachybacterium sp. NBEC-018]